MAPIIECSNVTKSYAPREHLSDLSGWQSWCRLRMGARQREPFDALRDVSFTVERGESVGIIGENGSGKTTLLKLIAGITQPSSGSISVEGRVGSLLEVGAGFHPEMTGRENIFLSGAILGMTQKQLSARVEEIARFSELDEFLDVPVKFYSSGMFVRLGFSVAIHCLPDVLLLDEILAVGDEHFQKKCVRAIEAYMEEGGTILYVSHDFRSTRLLCPRCLVLGDAHLIYDGETEAAISKYHHSLWQKHHVGVETETVFRNRFGTFDARILTVDLLDDQGRNQREFSVGEPIQIEIHYRVEKPIGESTIGLILRDCQGNLLHVCSTILMRLEIPTSLGEHHLRFRLGQLNLLPGLYDFTVVASSSVVSTQFPHDWRKYVYDIWYRLRTIQILPDQADQRRYEGSASLAIGWD